MPSFQGLILIGSLHKSTQLLLVDSRVVPLMRPAKVSSLFDTVKSLLNKSAPRTLVSKTLSLPSLSKDYPLLILAVDDNDVNRYARICGVLKTRTNSFSD